MKIFFFLSTLFVATLLFIGFGNNDFTRSADWLPSDVVTTGSRGEGPDLVIESFTLDPPNPLTTTPVTIKIRVRNQGNANSSGFRTRLYIDPNETPPTSDTSETTRWGYFLTLPPGGMVEFEYDQYTFTESGCNHVVYAWVDRENLVAESDEMNNLGRIDVCAEHMVIGADQYEPDNNCATQAKEISTNGLPQLHNFTPEEDTDWIKFQATEGTTYTITAAATGAESRPIIDLMDNCEAAGNFGTSSRLIFPATSNGEYYLRLQNLESSYNTDESSYLLTVDDGAEGVEPSLSSVEPSEGQNDRNTGITINGGNFLFPPLAELCAEQDGECGSDCTQLLNTSWLTLERLIGIVPTGLQGGQYCLAVSNPEGKRRVLPNAFTVISKLTPTPTPTVPSGEPINLDLQANQESINASWNVVGALSGNLHQYTLQRSTNGGPFTLVTTTSNTQYSDTDSQLSADIEYCYQINALDQNQNLIGQSNVACTQLGKLKLWIPHQVAQPGATSVPVTINLANGNDLCIGAMALTIDYDPTMVRATESVSRTMYTVAYVFDATTENSGQVKITSISSSSQCQALHGAGSLFDVHFDIIGPANQVSPLNFVRGLGATVIYDNDNLETPVELELEDGSLSIGSGFARGDINGDEVVNPADSALALRIASGLINPTMQGRGACDTNGDAACNSADASLILCYATIADWNRCAGLIFMRGDINGDRTVNAVDASDALNISNGLITPTPEQFAACDVNNDEVCDSTDSSHILCYAAFQDWGQCGAGSVIRGDVNGDGEVYADDAALALDIANGLITPTTEQRQACDVNNDGTCDSADSSLILCYAAFQDWASCGASAHLQADSNGPKETHTALAPFSAANLLQGQNDTVEVAIGQPVHSGQRIIVPITLTNGSGFAGGDFTFLYDANRMTATSASRTSLTNNFPMESKIEEPGIIHLSLASKEGIAIDNGEILQLEFTANSTISSIDFGRVLLHDATGRDFERSALQRQIQLVPYEGNSASNQLYLPLVIR